MDILFAIILFIGAAFLVSVLYIINKADDSDSTLPVATIGAFILAFVVGGIAILDDTYNPSIKPMDVYQGKTTLEITYRDSIAIDSVVVWKEEAK